MKLLSAIILLAMLFMSCKNKERKLSFSQNFNSSVLPLWEQQTESNLKQRKDPKLLSLFDSPKEDSMTIFFRRDFLQDISTIKKLQKYQFDSLLVIEITRTGEENTLTKLLLAFRQQKVEIIKFRLAINRWKLVQSYELKKNKVDNLVKQILTPDHNKYYWGFYVTDVMAISKFRGSNDYAVAVYGSLSKPRYEAFLQLEKGGKSSL